MPVPPKGSTILVTGASGYIGCHTVGTLLDAGYRVRVTTRSLPKAEYIRSLFPSHAGAIEHAIVEEMTAPGAYDDAVASVSGVVHLASAIHIADSTLPADAVTEAVAGVTNLLEALSRSPGTVARVVQMSLKLCDELGAATPAADKYAAQKTRAEQAFWASFEQAQPTPKWDGVALNPGFCLGPPTLYGGGLDGSSLYVLKPFLRTSTPAELDEAIGNFVDVRDVALAVLRALETPSAGGERYLLSNGPLFGNDIAVAAARAFSPEEAARRALTTPHDAAWRTRRLKSAVVTDGSKAARQLGIRYRSLQESLADTFAVVLKDEL
ncbi:NADPH-dependent aldehyde reductase ARI1 [Vanrija pseudolonga]|uniref:NADPH-dependent aldehyde reductase ARI1 n=1 Tax=Vanrija pseudolonga TaxID=143232 RepID=A0AAF0Y244_9TREE|nr:NADPH-dependent aldehyde reductase ARI1 [Vanrija pseudolonga]